MRVLSAVKDFLFSRWRMLAPFYIPHSVGDMSRRRALLFACVRKSQGRGPYSGGRCWPRLAGIWRAVAPCLAPWCAEGEVPTAANLNLCREKGRMLRGTATTRNCLGYVGNRRSSSRGVLGPLRNSCGSLSPAWAVRRVRAGSNMVTFRSWMVNARMTLFTAPSSFGWRTDEYHFSMVERHGSGCPLAGVFVSGLPTCAQVSSVLPPVAGVCWGVSCGLQGSGVTVGKAGRVDAQDTYFEL